MAFDGKPSYENAVRTIKFDESQIDLEKTIKMVDRKLLKIGDIVRFVGEQHKRIGITGTLDGPMTLKNNDVILVLCEGLDYRQEWLIVVCNSRFILTHDSTISPHDITTGFVGIDA